MVKLFDTYPQGTVLEPRAHTIREVQNELSDSLKCEAKGPK